MKNPLSTSAKADSTIDLACLALANYQYRCKVSVSVEVGPMQYFVYSFFYAKSTYVSFEFYTSVRFFYAKGKTGRECGLATMLPGSPKFINQDESCPGFGGQS